MGNRNRCPKCGSEFRKQYDFDDLPQEYKSGSFPGLTYTVCNACGDCSVVKRTRVTKKKLIADTFGKAKGE